MLDATTFVGLDVHARSIKAVALDVMTGEVRAATFGYDAASVAQWIASVDPAAKCVYESGVTGFDLQKKLSSLGVDCVIGAVSKMIKPSADKRRKNDRNDAEFLARMLSVGNVVEVWVPDDECEAARAKGQAPSEAARRHASKGTRRLVARRESMLERGIHKNKANVATARELACWVWAVGLMAERG